MLLGNTTVIIEVFKAAGKPEELHIDKIMDILESDDFTNNSETLKVAKVDKEDFIPAMQELATEIADNEKSNSTREIIKYKDIKLANDMLNGLKSLINMAMAPKRGLTTTSPIVGYKIKNVSNEPIPYTRMTATPDHTTSQALLNPGEEICLSRTELTLLGSNPSIA